MPTPAQHDHEDYPPPSTAWWVVIVLAIAYVFSDEAASAHTADGRSPSGR